MSRWFGNKDTAAPATSTASDALCVEGDDETLPLALAVPAGDEDEAAAADDYRPLPSAPTAPTEEPSSSEPSSLTRPESSYQESTQQQSMIDFDSRYPTELSICPHCSHRNVRTRVRTAPDLWTWVATVALFFGCCILSWIPLVNDRCKRTDHYCTHCQSKIGSIGSFQDCCAKHRR